MSDCPIVGNLPIANFSDLGWKYIVVGDYDDLVSTYPAADYSGEIVFVSNVKTDANGFEEKQNGLYISNGTTWNEVPLRVQFVDDSLEFRDDADTSKILKFQLSGIGTGLTKVVTFPNRDLDLGNPEFDNLDVNGESVFNKSAGDFDFIIYKKNSGVAYRFDAGLDKHYLSSPVLMSNITGLSPTDALVVAGESAAAAAVDIDLYSDNATGPALYLSKARGTFASKSAVQSGDFISFMGFYGYGASAYQYSAAIAVESMENFTDAASGSRMLFGVTPIGTNSVINALIIEDNGDIENITKKVNGVYSALDVSQAAHGFSVKNVLYNNAGTWTKAQADNASTLGIAIVTKVDGVNDFTIVSLGYAYIASHGLTVGDYYYLSAGTAGVLTNTPPSAQGQYSNPICYVIDANTLLVLPWRPIEALQRYTNVSVQTISSTTFNCNELDEMLLCDCSSNSITVNLLSPESKYSGFKFIIKKIDSGANTVTIKSASGNIDGTLGTTGIVISAQYESLTIVCDGVNYWVE